VAGWNSVAPLGGRLGFCSCPNSGDQEHGQPGLQQVPQSRSERADAERPRIVAATPPARSTAAALDTANKKIDYIYFPDCGLVSLVGGPTKGSRELEIGVIGSEGMTGLPVIYGDDRSPHRMFMQIAGDGHRIPAATLRKAFDHSVTLRHRLLKYAQAFMIHTTYTAIANARGTLQQRLSRWILMAQDRVGSGEIPMTHEFLSLMLAVRRPGVTEALHGLAHNGIITHSRGTVVVLDREGLIECAAGLYGIPENEYERLMGKPARLQEQVRGGVSSP
jgi:CRP-like cAMP-binding protein